MEVLRGSIWEVLLSRWFKAMEGLCSKMVASLIMSRTFWRFPSDPCESGELSPAWSNNPRRERFLGGSRCGLGRTLQLQLPLLLPLRHSLRSRNLWRNRSRSTWCLGCVPSDIVQEAMLHQKRYCAGNDAVQDAILYRKRCCTGSDTVYIGMHRRFTGGNTAQEAILYRK